MSIDIKNKATMRRRKLLTAAWLPFTGLATAAPPPKEEMIARVEAIPVSIPYKRTFVIARGQVAKGGAAGTYVFVRIETSGGRVGWGETIALPSWSYETVESICAVVRNNLAPIAIGRSPFDHAWFEKQFDSTLAPAVSNGFPFAKGAFLTAALDLAGQISNVPVHRLFGGKLRDTVELSFALSIDTPAEMARAAAESPGIKCFKVKVQGDAALDIERVRAVAAARPDLAIWIDANQSYRPVHLEAFLRGIRDVPGVKCLEQPVRSADLLGMKRAREKMSIPLAVDEGCFSPADVARVAKMEAADLLVLKIAKSGGLWNCCRCAAIADAHGLGLLGSGLTESGVGLTATIHLFSTLELLLPPELNGPRFLADLLVDGLEVRGNVVTVPDGPGLGIRVKEEQIRKLAIRA